jgi:hypothetical protein
MSAPPAEKAITGSTTLRPNAVMVTKKTRKASSPSTMLSSDSVSERRRRGLPAPVAAWSSVMASTCVPSRG